MGVVHMGVVQMGVVRSGVVQLGVVQMGVDRVQDNHIRVHPNLECPHLDLILLARVGWC